MSQDKLDYTSEKTAQEAYDIVVANVTEEVLAEFKVNATIDYHPEDLLIRAHGKGFELFMNFYDEYVTTDLKLSLLLRPIKGQVLGTLHKMLKKVL